MKKILSISTLILMSMLANMSAQSFKTLKKAQKAIISLNTYDKNGELLHSGTAFYIGKDGEAIADYSIFKDSYKASVIDMKGEKADIDCILGVDDTYSVVRFRVATKGNSALPLASSRLDNGTTVYAVPYSNEKIKICKSTTIESFAPIQEKYSYYTLSSNVDSINIGCPLFNEAGEVIGILQSPVGNKGYALDIQYKNELSIKAITNSSNNLALNSIHISKDVPESVEEALVYTYFKSRSAGNEEYLDIMNRFIRKFPENAEGYLRRCTPLTDMLRFDEANSDLEKYLSLATDKGASEYNVAQTIYNKLTYLPKPEYEKWTYDIALTHIDNSITNYTLQKDEKQIVNGKILKAKIYMGKKDYNQAISIYDDLINNPECNTSSIYYAKSLACEQRGDSIKDLIILMDSAISKFGKPLPAEAANYMLRRGQLYNAIGNPRKAVVNYNEYCYLMNHKVSDVFYYDKCQLEMEAHMYQQAYEDITSAITLAPNNLDYKVEKAGMCLRFNYIDECIEICNNVLKIIPEDITTLRILGYAELQKGNKDSAKTYLQKAILLGDKLSQDLMDKYFK